jgi:hypothetical protein
MHLAVRLAFAGVLAIALPMAAMAAPNKPNPPGGPNHPTSSYEPPCEYDMGYLRPVTVKQVGGIDDEWKVWIRPVCERSPHAPVRNLGNATQLIGAIGRNEVLEAALDAKNYLPDDVVGVQLTKGERAILWVHPSLY